MKANFKRFFLIVSIVGYFIGIQAIQVKTQSVHERIGKLEKQIKKVKQANHAMELAYLSKTRLENISHKAQTDLNMKRPKNIHYLVVPKGPKISTD